MQTLQTQYRTIYPNTQNFQGQTVGSTSYFNGEYVYVDLSSYAYSGYTGQSFPATNQTANQPNASWDFSYLYRVPVFFRALFDNKKATGINFPSRQDMQGLANQLVYKTFQGNYDLPLFNNYFDGSNGWYRVGYDGASFGYPPAEYCNSFAQVGNYTLACLNAGGVQGWGLISFVNEDLAELEHSLGKLALSQDATQTSFLMWHHLLLESGFLDAGRPIKPAIPHYVVLRFAWLLQIDCSDSQGWAVADKRNHLMEAESWYEKSLWTSRENQAALQGAVDVPSVARIEQDLNQCKNALVSASR